MSASVSRENAPPESVRTLFRLSMECERLAADFYDELSRGFSGTPEVADFWKEMREDERGHIRRLREISEVLPEAVLSRSAKADDVDLARRVAATLLELRLRPIHNLDDAYETAHEMEHSEINHLFRLLTQEFVPLADRNNTYWAEIDAHQDKLVSFGRLYRGRDRRRSVPFEPPAEERAAG